MKAKDDKDPALKVLSLYSGAGGLDLGFKRAGFDLVWANEIDPDSVKTYQANLGDHIHLGDVDKTSFPKIEVDVIIGGPPCQGFSVAGYMDPSDPRSKHVFNFLDWVEHYKPRAFVMENVKNLARNNRFGMVRDKLFQRAEDMGYGVKLFVLNASEYGVPQARERMFFVGILEDKPTRPPRKRGAKPTVRDALKSLPPYGDPGNDTKVAAVITPAKNPVLRKSPYAGMLFNGAGRPLDLDQPSATLPASMGGNRTPIIDQYQWEHGGDSWVVDYHSRLMSGKKPLKKVSPNLRRLTLEEAQALQSFPLNWKFSGRLSSQFSQIGNAVPPLLAQAVAAQLLKDLGSI